jgi:PRTRC genetic system protein E
MEVDMSDGKSHPVIDFTRLKEMIPDEGSLVLVLAKTGDTLVITYAPKHKGKETDANLMPFTFRATPEELNEQFEAYVSDLPALEREYAKRTTSTSTVKASAQKRKETLQKGIEKSDKASPKGTEAPQAKEEKPQAGQGMLDLCSGDPCAGKPPEEEAGKAGTPSEATPAVTASQATQEEPAATAPETA